MIKISAVSNSLGDQRQSGDQICESRNFPGSQTNRTKTNLVRKEEDGVSSWAGGTQGSVAGGGGDGAGWRVGGRWEMGRHTRINFASLSPK